MIFRYEYQNGLSAGTQGVWLDLEQPTEDEIHEAVCEFSIGGQIEKELVSPTPTPIVLDGVGHTLLVLHFPTQGTEDGETENHEIDIVIGDHFILTVHYGVIAPLHHLKKLLEARTLIAKSEFITTDALLEIFFAHLYAATRDHVSHLTNRLTHIEKNMFDGHERDTVRTISNVSRAFLHLEAALANHEEPLTTFLKARAIQTFFGESFSLRAERILAERTQVMHLVKTHRAVATELRETNIAILEARQNEIMRTLAILTVIAELLVVTFSALLIFRP